jgi:hypothetical protein
MKKDELIPRLISEFNYPQSGAEIVAEKIIKSSPIVQKAFNEFWESGTIPEIEIEGYTIASLSNAHGMKPIAALLTLDWLIRDPASAKKSLEKGHDFVGK